MDQQPTHIVVPALADARQVGLPAGGILCRGQLSRVGVIRPPRVGIYRPALPVPKGVSNDPIEELILMR